MLDKFGSLTNPVFRSQRKRKATLPFQCFGTIHSFIRGRLSFSFSLATGFVKDLDDDSIQVKLERELRIPPALKMKRRNKETLDIRNAKWRLDKGEFLSSFSQMRFNLYSILMKQKERSERTSKLSQQWAAHRDQNTERPKKSLFGNKKVEPKNWYDE